MPSMAYHARDPVVPLTSGTDSLAFDLWTPATLVFLLFLKYSSYTPSLGLWHCYSLLAGNVFLRISTGFESLCKCHLLNEGHPDHPISKCNQPLCSSSPPSSLPWGSRCYWYPDSPSPHVGLLPAAVVNVSSQLIAFPVRHLMFLFNVLRISPPLKLAEPAGGSSEGRKI